MIAPPFPNPIKKMGSGSASIVHRQNRFDWPSLELIASQENISQPTDWQRMDESRHALIVHLGGQMNELATELEGRFGSVGPATSGEIWSVPAGRSYASYAVGGDIEFAVLSLPVGSPEIANRDLACLAGHRDDRLHQLVRALLRLLIATDDAAQMEAETIAQSVTSHVASNYAVEDEPRHKDNHKLNSLQARMLREYIGDNLADHITLRMLAETVGLTEHQLLEAFRATFCTTPAQYLITQRLRRAQWLLRYTALDITTIALASGFASHSHMTSTFSRRIGTTPSRFRSSCA